MRQSFTFAIWLCYLILFINCPFVFNAVILFAVLLSTTLVGLIYLTHIIQLRFLSNWLKVLIMIAVRVAVIYLWRSLFLLFVFFFSWNRLVCCRFLNLSFLQLALGLHYIKSTFQSIFFIITTAFLERWRIAFFSKLIDIFYFLLFANKILKVFDRFVKVPLESSIKAITS